MSQEECVSQNTVAQDILSDVSEDACSQEPKAAAHVDSGSPKASGENIDEKETVGESTNVEATIDNTNVAQDEVVPPCDSSEGQTVKEQPVLASLESNDPRLETIKQYMKLVANKKSHVQLLKDETISAFLVYCLGEQDSQLVELVERSFEVFDTISKFQINLPELRRVNYLVDALRDVAKNPAVRSSTRLGAKNLIAELKSCSKRELETKNKNQPLSELSESLKNTLHVSNSENRCEPDPAPSSSMSVQENLPAKSELNRTMSTMKRKNKGRETILFLENNVIQQKSQRLKITQALMAAPGIISVTYDPKNNYCILRGKRTVPQEDFAKAVATLGLANVWLVRKMENKEEFKFLITANEKENSRLAMPPYPEELENEVTDNSAALARPGADENQDNASFFKSAKNFIKRSFYW